MVFHPRTTRMERGEGLSLLGRGDPEERASDGARGFLGAVISGDHLGEEDARPGGSTVTSNGRSSAAWVVRAAVLIALVAAAAVGAAAATAFQRRDASSALLGVSGARGLTRDFGDHSTGMHMPSPQVHRRVQQHGSRKRPVKILATAALGSGGVDETREGDGSEMGTTTLPPQIDDDEKKVDRPLPIYFHIEKSGGTSLVLYLLSLLSTTDEQRELVQRTRSEDNVFDSELRAARLLCPGSAMFLTTVFVDNAESFSTFPKPLKDSSEESWRGCRLATSHQGQALQTIVRADMARVGIPERRFVTLGMFRDPVQFEQAAWRSELFMYHADRKALGWGTLTDSKFGTRIPREALADFGDASAFAKTMRDVHCKNNRDNNYQTKKLIDDMWWRFQERMDKGVDPEELHAEAVDIALDRVNNLAWVGLTHRFEESACSLAYVLRKTPQDVRMTNYDRGGLISEAFRGNHPHSGSAWEGAMSKELRKTLYECNAMDTLLVKTAAKRWEADLREMERVLDESIATNRPLPSLGYGEDEELDPRTFKKCLDRARERRKEAQGGGSGQPAPVPTTRAA